MQEAHTLIVPWESFYVIVGSSGAALTGLQFVVIALTTESARPSTSRELATFATPTVIHFCAVLLLAAILSAPWTGAFQRGLGAGRMWRRRPVVQRDHFPSRETKDCLPAGAGGLDLAHHPAD